MDLQGRSYRYVGPAELRALIRPGAEGCGIRSAADFEDWISGRPGAELSEPFTFVVDAARVLRLAPRRSEHVVCAGGGPVLSAGEMGFGRESGRWVVRTLSNQLRLRLLRRVPATGLERAPVSRVGPARHGNCRAPPRRSLPTDPPREAGTGARESRRPVFG
ncbi:hypothetical protein [Streptomyces sp. NPDC090036]|uniref:hypothetical protein n=1 Tax=Streptomyces sp. NPDC090036 TaxID=3365926 RepID=UPI00382E609B